ncbi:MAG: YjgP/YjgQ family permease [Sphingomonadales bacterium]|nr:YjgP/YjgQ family permease [Sphingomonadales bacterium]
MGVLGRLLIRTFAGPFILTFFIVLFILVMQFLWVYMDDLVGKGLEWYVIAELLMYASASFVPMALPLAMLLSSIMTLGQFGEYNELTATRAAGISLWKLVRPLLLLSVLFSVAAFLFSDTLLPQSRLKFGSLLFDIQQKKPALSIKEGRFYTEIENYALRVGQKSEDGEHLRDILIYDHSSGRGNTSVITAKRGRMTMSADQRYLSLKLYDGYTYEELQEDAPSRRNRPHLKTSFAVQEIHFDLSSFNMKRSDESIFRDYFSMLNLNQLKQATDSLETAYEERDRDIRHTMKQFYHFSDSLLFASKSNATHRDAHRLQVRGTHSMQESVQSTSSTESGQSLMDVDTTSNSSYSEAETLSVLGRQNLPTREATNLPGGAGQIIESVRTRGDSLAAIWAEKRRNEQQITHTDSITLLRDAVQSAQTLQGYSSMRLRELEGRRHMLNRHYLEIHRKFSLSFACFLFFLIGAPMGALIRRGGLGFPMLISILLFLIYHVITMSSEKLARDGVVDVHLGMWISSIVLLPAGVLLTLAANREGRIPLPRLSGFWGRKKPTN